MHPVNRILASLPAAEIAMLAPHLIPIPLKMHQIVHVRGHMVPDILFVEQGIVSLTVAINGNGDAEVGLIGREGVVGGWALLRPTAVLRQKAFVQVGGNGFRVPTSIVLGLLEHLPTLRAGCFGFLDRLAAQTAQVAGCNLHHTLLERMARWLLMTRDRVDSDDLPITHEFLAVMLGVRRNGVSLAASTLQAAGLIRQLRGRIIILNHEGLIAAACSCYQIIKELSDTEH